MDVGFTRSQVRSWAGVVVVALSHLGTINCAGLEASDSEFSEARANFRVVVATDLGWSDVGAFGGKVRAAYVDLGQGQAEAAFHGHREGVAR